MNRNITKKEMLLAIAMSEYYQITHVHYIPPATSFRFMLKTLVSTKLIEPMTKEFYKLTKKGRNYILRQDIEQFKDVDSKVDNFIKSLENNNCFGG